MQLLCFDDFSYNLFVCTILPGFPCKWLKTAILHGGGGGTYARLAIAAHECRHSESKKKASAAHAD